MIQATEKTQHRILIVEDSPTQAQQLRYILEAHDFAVHHAKNGCEALSLLQEERVELVITDIIMPEMDGYALCKAIKNDETLRRLPVILLTSLTDTLDVLRGLECGADNFIAKPYKEENLLRQIESILNDSNSIDEAKTENPLEIAFADEHFTLTSHRLQILNLLLSSYETAVQKNAELKKTQEELRNLNVHLEELVSERTKSLEDEVVRRSNAEEKLRKRLNMERALVVVSQILSSNPEPDCGNILRILGEAVGAERAYIFEKIQSRNEIQKTHEWCSGSGTPQIQDRKKLPISDFPWWIEQLKAGEAIVIEDTGTLSPEAASENDFMLHPDARSLLVMPIASDEDEFSGFIGFGELEKHHKWHEEDVQILTIAAEMLGNHWKRKKAHDSLSASETRYRMLFEDDLTGNAIFAADGQILDCNPAFVRMFGFESHEQATRGNTTDLYPEASAYKSIVRELKTKKRTESLEMEMRTADEKVLYTLSNFSGIFDDTDEITGVRAYLLNVTDRKKLEQQLLQAQKMEAVGMLAGGIAHDFNNLVMVINGYAKLVLKQLDSDSDLREDLEEIESAGNRAASLTRQLLAFSRRQVLKPEILDLNQIISNMDKMLRRVIGEDIDLLTHADSNLQFVEADPGQIEQIVMNLAVNARDAMPNGGKLTIETGNFEMTEEYMKSHFDSKPGPYVMLAVSDTGIGMAPETRDRIFEPFFTTKDVGKGTGLGLSTVYGIVKQSGGCIQVYSELNHGTSFKIYLPQARKKKKAVDSVQSVLVQGEETILYVEDESAVRKLVCRGLRNYGYRVLEASNGLEALSVFEENMNRIDLVITDVIMPEMGGRDLMLKIRELKPSIRIIFISGYTDKAILHNGILDKHEVFIQKPISVERVAEAVRSAINREVKQ